MFFKKFKIQTLILLLTIFIIPQTLFAYSNKIIAGGNTVGIKLNTNGILIVGSYQVNGHNSLNETGLKIGDLISTINNKEVHTIEEMANIINECNCDSLLVTYLRNNEIHETTLSLYQDNGNLKTGLYVKDSISGVGTLTYIDPNTKLFGVLGHEIIDNNTGQIINIKDDLVTQFNKVKEVMSRKWPNAKYIGY